MYDLYITYTLISCMWQRDCGINTPVGMTVASRENCHVYVLTNIPSNSHIKIHRKYIRKYIRKRRLPEFPPQILGMSHLVETLRNERVKWVPQKSWPRNWQLSTKQYKMRLMWYAGTLKDTLMNTATEMRGNVKTAWGRERERERNITAEWRYRGSLLMKNEISEEDQLSSN